MISAGDEPPAPQPYQSIFRRSGYRFGAENATKQQPTELKRPAKALARGLLPPL
jgi:hypothetical protein